MYYVVWHSREETHQFYSRMLSKLWSDFAPALSYVCVLQGMGVTPRPYTQELIILMQSRDNEDGDHRVEMFKCLKCI